MRETVSQLEVDNDYLRSALASAYFREVLRRCWSESEDEEDILFILNDNLDSYKEKLTDRKWVELTLAPHQVFTQVVVKIEEEIERLTNYKKLS